MVKTKEKPKKLLLIDADVALHRACFAAEVPTEWEEGLFTYHGYISTAKNIFMQEIEKYREAFHPDSAVYLFFTGSENYRKDFFPEYKSNRASVRKPLLLKAMKEWVMTLPDARMREGLEADDLLGLYHHLHADSVMVSIDKDLKTVVGLHYNPDHPEDGVYQVTKDEAHRTHMTQTLCGDSTDGYKGCPTVGIKTVEKLFKDVEPCDYWGVVVDTFASKKISEEDAIVQARLAYILQGDAYDFKTSKVTLWEP